MSVEVKFMFSWGLSKTLTVPAGTKAKALEHVAYVQRILKLEYQPAYEGNVKAYGENYPGNWNSWGRDFSKVDRDLLCKTVEDHNAWVAFMYERLAEWSKTPFVPTTWVKETEQLTPADAKEFWHGFEEIHLPPDLWNRDYYRARMEACYEVMRGRPSEGHHFDEKPLTQQQAGAVINLFSNWLDNYDMRLDVVQSPGRGFNGQDRLASSYDGGYDYCSGDKSGEGCYKAIDFDCIGECKRRNCPLLKEAC